MEFLNACKEYTYRPTPEKGLGEEAAAEDDMTAWPMEREYKIVSPTAVQFDWNEDDLNTLTISDNNREFTRFMQRDRSTHSGEIRKATK